MKLSKRLQAICDFIPNNSKVIDVGADHALTSIYLNKYKNCNVLATDISENCITKAKENIKKHNSNVKTIVTDGLNNINLTNEIIILSGMGTHTILKILNKPITNDLIISSNNHIPLLKKELFKKDYHIYKEVAIKEKHYYVITYYKYGKKKTNPIISPFLINNTDYLNYILKEYQLKEKHEKNIIKKSKYKYYIYRIKKLL